MESEIETKLPPITASAIPSIDPTVPYKEPALPVKIPTKLRKSKRKEAKKTGKRNMARGTMMVMDVSPDCQREDTAFAENNHNSAPESGTLEIEGECEPKILSAFERRMEALNKDRESIFNFSHVAFTSIHEKFADLQTKADLLRDLEIQRVNNWYECVLQWTETEENSGHIFAEQKLISNISEQIFNLNIENELALKAEAASKKPASPDNEITVFKSSSRKGKQGKSYNKKKSNDTCESLSPEINAIIIDKGRECIPLELEVSKFEKNGRVLRERSKKNTPDMSENIKSEKHLLDRAEEDAEKTKRVKKDKESLMKSISTKKSNSARKNAKVPNTPVILKPAPVVYVQNVPGLQENPQNQQWSMTIQSGGSLHAMAPMKIPAAPPIANYPTHSPLTTSQSKEIGHLQLVPAQIGHHNQVTQRMIPQRQPPMGVTIPTIGRPRKNLAVAPPQRKLITPNQKVNKVSQPRINLIVSPQNHTPISPLEPTPFDNIYCSICGKGDKEEDLIICDNPSCKHGGGKHSSCMYADKARGVSEDEFLTWYCNTDCIQHCGVCKQPLNRADMLSCQGCRNKIHQRCVMVRNQNGSFWCSRKCMETVLPVRIEYRAQNERAGEKLVKETQG